MTSPHRSLSVRDGDFPDRLRRLADPPAKLWIRTELTPGGLAAQLWPAPAVAIVGTRAASHAGLELARGFAWELARAGVVVVSGLARGIDGAAHRGAVMAGGRSVAVLACGLDLCYPPEHGGLAGELAARGALLSEWPPGTPPVGWRFPRRNRLISALADAVVLVEAPAQSGAMHTVRFALDQGREVLAVPRDPVTPGSAGPNRLLREGAPPVTSADDVLSALGLEAGGGGATRLFPDGGHRSIGDRLASHLGARPAQRAGEVTRAFPDLDPADVLAELVTLEVEGRVKRDAAGRYHVAVSG